jgi:hypothetical protein
MINLLTPKQKAELGRAEQQIVIELLATIRLRVINRLVEEATPGNYRTALYSCVNGRWDDLVKDVQRGRVTRQEAQEIIEKIREARLISDAVAETMLERVQ